jgi:uncharacterized membrane protein (DUF106 family)
MTQQQGERTLRYVPVIALIVGVLSGVLGSIITSQVSLARIDERVMSIKEVVSEQGKRLETRVDRLEERIREVEQKMGGRS